MGLFRRFIYDNFLRPSRLPYLDEVMRKLREAGYQGYTVAELNKQLQMGDSQQTLQGGVKSVWFFATTLTPTLAQHG